METEKRIDKLENQANCHGKKIAVLETIAEDNKESNKNLGKYMVAMLIGIGLIVVEFFISLVR